MRPTYLLIVDESRQPCIADLTEQGPGLYMVNRINVPVDARGNRYGTRLLANICKDADAEGVVLYLEANATPVVRNRKTIGLTQRKLQAWYLRHGFRWYTPAGTPATGAHHMRWYMVRAPGAEALDGSAVWPEHLPQLMANTTGAPVPA